MKNKKKGNIETLSKKEKEMIRCIIKDSNKEKERLDNHIMIQIEKLSLYVLDDFEMILKKLLKEYDALIIEVLTLNSYEEILKKTNQYIRLENILLGINYFIEPFLEKCKESFIEGLELDLERELKSVKKEICYLIETVKDIKHKKEVIDEVMLRYKSIFKKNRNSKIEYLEEVIENIKVILGEYIAEEIDIRSDNINVLNSHMKSIDKGNISNFHIYISQEETKLNICKIDITSDKNVRIKIKQNIVYSTLEDLESEIDTPTINLIKENENENGELEISTTNLVADGTMRMKDGRKIIFKGNSYSVDSSEITDKNYSYKELNSIAMKLGYKADRSNGDHLIFTKNNAPNIIIPQKRLGRGIQLKILKDLKMI